MAQFIIVKEFPINTDNLEKSEVRGLSIQQWLEIRYSKVGKFEQPMFCILNHDKVEEKDFADTYPKENDIVTFAPQVNGIVGIIIAVIAIIIAVYVALTMEVPNVTGLSGDSQTENDPVYSLQGRKNTAKLGASIPRHYGLGVIYPDYGMRSYNQFYGNRDHLYQGFCLGLGSYDIHEVNIEDSPASSFGAEVQIVEPFGDLTLIPTNVETAPEVTNTRVLGPNESGYPASSGWYGPYAANSSGTKAYRIELDVVFPKGAFEQDSAGAIIPLYTDTPRLESQYVLLDDLGNEVGDWIPLSTQTFRGGSLKVIRVTSGIDVAKGRFAVRFRRTSNARGDSSSRVNDDMHVVGLRTFLESDISYGDVTMIATKLVATNNISGQTANRLNVLCTAKIPVWSREKKGWGRPVATRSIVWAFCDIIRSEYGANLADKFLDLEELYDIDQELTAEGRFFDWTFDKQSSVWEALKLCARNARGVPIPKSTVISMKRDKAQSVRKAMFAPQNILAGSMSWGVSLARVGKFDGVEVEYVDPVTHKPEQVLCTIDNDTGDNPQRIRFSGCKDRDWAYREGLYMRSQAIDQNRTVSFQTGFEGLSIQYGDLILVADDIQSDGASTGEIVDISGVTVTLSEPVAFGAGQHVIAIRTRTGGVSGLWNVSPGTDEYEVILDSLIPDDYTVPDDAERPFYMFGAVTFRDMVVTSMKPSTDEIVEVNAVNYSPRIFTFDTLTAPAIDNPITTPITPTLPAVTGLEVKQVTNSLAYAIAEWEVAPGAQYYIVETSVDGDFWEEETTTSGTSVNIATPVGILWVRVAAVNSGAGPWDTWSGDLGTPEYAPADVTGLGSLGEFTEKLISVLWEPVTLATAYDVSLYSVPDPQGVPDGVLVGDSVVTGTAYSITHAQIEAVSTVTRDYRITVVARNTVGDSEGTAILDMTNLKPIAPTITGVQIISETSAQATLEFRWDSLSDGDISSYKLWVSDTQGFTPDDSIKVYDAIPNTYTTTVDKVSGSLPTLYWRVAAVDVWGDDYTLSAEQSEFT